MKEMNKQKINVREIKKQKINVREMCTATESGIECDRQKAETGRQAGPLAIRSKLQSWTN